MGIFIRCAGHNGPDVIYPKDPRQGGAMHRPYGREDSIPRKKVEIFLFFPKIALYIWGYLWYHQKAGHEPDDISMPVAQLWEKAV